MTIQIKRGLDLPIAGKPAQCVADTVPTERVALLGADYPGLRPDLLVAEGDRVCLGQPLFGDRAMPEVKFTAPASGVVTAIHRGARRRLQSVVIQRDGNEERAFDSWSSSKLNQLDRHSGHDAHDIGVDRRVHRSTRHLSLP